MKRDLALLSLSLLIWGVGEGLFLYFQPIYLEQLGANPVTIGATLGAYGLTMTVAHIPAGLLADRYGRKRLMFAAWLLGTLAAWIMALAVALPVFIVGLLLYGLTIFVAAPLNSYLTAARGTWSVGRTITLVDASFNLGVVVGPFLGGRIGDQMGLRQTYWIAAVLFMLSTGIFVLIRRQPVDSPDQGQPRSELLKSRPFLIYLLVVFLAMSVMYLPQPLSPNYLQNERGLSLGSIGGLYAITGIGIVILNLVLGQVQTQWGFLISQIAVGAFAVLLWKGGGLPWYALGYFLLGGYRTARALAVAQARPLVNPASMGLAYGMIETICGLATVLTPPLAGLLYSTNPVWMYSLSALLIVMAILASGRFSKRNWGRVLEEGSHHA